MSLLPRQRQVEQQILGFHAQQPVFIGGQREVNGFAGDIGLLVAQTFEVQPHQQQQPAVFVRTEALVAPELIEQPARLGIEADMPAPARIVDGRQARNFHAHAQQVADPARQQIADQETGRAAVGELEGEVVAFVAAEIGGRIALVQHIEVDTGGAHPTLGQQSPEIAQALRLRALLDTLGIGQQDSAVDQRNALIAKPEFGHPQHQAQPAFHIGQVVAAEIGDRDAFDVFHREERRAVVGFATMGLQALAEVGKGILTLSGRPIGVYARG